MLADDYVGKSTKELEALLPAMLEKSIGALV
jgi:hypothetical protein